MTYTKEQAREDLKENFEEIDWDDWCKLNNVGEFRIRCDKGIIYFKAKQKLPIVFEDNFREIKVDKDYIEIKNKYDNTEIDFGIDGSLNLLIEAVDKWKELQKA